MSFIDNGNGTVTDDETGVVYPTRPTRQSVTDLLAERHTTHGNALDNALAYCPENPLQYPMDMIRVKLARLTTGDRRHRDHWADIEGYARMALGFLEDDDNA